MKVLRTTFTSRNPYKHRGFKAKGEGWRKKHVIHSFWSCGMFYFSYLRVASRLEVTPLWLRYDSAVTPLFGLTRSSVLYLHQMTVVVLSLCLLLWIVNRATTKYKDSLFTYYLNYGCDTIRISYRYMHKSLCMSIRKLWTDIRKLWTDIRRLRTEN